MKLSNFKYISIVLSFIWFFLFDYTLKSGGQETIAVITNYFIYVSFSAWFIYLLVRRSRLLRVPRVNLLYQKLGILVLLYLLLAGVQPILNQGSSDFETFISNYSVVLPSFFLAMILALFASVDPKREAKTLRLLFVIMWVTVLYSEIIITTGLGAIVQDGDYRSAGVFDQANNYGYFLSILLLFNTIDLNGYVKLSPNKAISAISYVIILGLIIKTGSYGALIVGVVTGLYISLELIRSISVSRVLSILLFTLILTLGLNYYSSQFTSNRFTALTEFVTTGSATTIQEESTFDKRFDLLFRGLGTVLDNPIIGKGYSGRLIDLDGKRIPVHNVFLVEALKGGLTNLLVFSGLFIVLYKAIRRIRIKERRRICYALLFYLFFIDNTLTYSSFLSMNSGVIALSALLLLIFRDITERFEYLLKVKQESKLEVKSLA